MDMSAKEYSKTPNRVIYLCIPIIPQAYCPVSEATRKERVLRRSFTETFYRCRSPMLPVSELYTRRVFEATLTGVKYLNLSV